MDQLALLENPRVRVYEGCSGCATFLKVFEFDAGNGGDLSRSCNKHRQYRAADDAVVSTHC